MNNPNQTKTFQINNRRYLGNKYKLTNFIRNIVDNECGDYECVADIFAGTGSVAAAFQDKRLITNDILYSNYICHVAWFGSQKYNLHKIEKYIEYYNSVSCIDENYMSENFGDTYFSRDDCKRIGFIREDIERQFENHKINFREKSILITSLIYAMDKIANTCGHYDAYFKNAQYNRKLCLLVPEIVATNHPNNKCYNEDANQLVKKISCDICYIDPPYNSRQYATAYHVLENVACWKKPDVKGIARKMDTSNLSSDYCTESAFSSFKSLIHDIHAKYILLSYNNMSAKGNSRSNAKISDDQILSVLSEKGETTIYSFDYKPFSAGKSNLADIKERIFLCKVYDEHELVPSPFNYMGNKQKLISQFINVFPHKIGTFVDLFCGGCTVGINSGADKIIFNDSNERLISIVQTFKRLDDNVIFNQIDSLINKYGLSRTSEYGYEHYGCNSRDGLASYNREHYMRLRDDYNRENYSSYDKNIMLYVLIVYSFNNQIRFNDIGEFNLPVGKRDFNDKIRAKLSLFLSALKKNNCEIVSNDFRQMDLSGIKGDVFVYADPPYLITCATYNESDAWTERDENDLLEYLDRLDCLGIKFALSNVLYAKNKTNTILLNWINNHGNYKVYHVSSDYSNSSYHLVDKTSYVDEVLVTNY